MRRGAEHSVIGVTRFSLLLMPVLYVPVRWIVAKLKNQENERRCAMLRREHGSISTVTVRLSTGAEVPSIASVRASLFSESDRIHSLFGRWLCAACTSGWSSQSSDRMKGGQ